MLSCWATCLNYHPHFVCVQAYFYPYLTAPNTVAFLLPTAHPPNTHICAQGRLAVSEVSAHLWKSILNLFAHQSSISRSKSTWIEKCWRVWGPVIPGTTNTNADEMELCWKLPPQQREGVRHECTAWPKGTDHRLWTQDWQGLGFVICLVCAFGQLGQWQPTPVLLPGKSHGWRSLVGCPWGR